MFAIAMFACAIGACLLYRMTTVKIHTRDTLTTTATQALCGVLALRPTLFLIRDSLDRADRLEGVYRCLACRAGNVCDSLACGARRMSTARRNE
jgi:hypothetical protein